VSAWELSPKNMLGENHKIGSKVKFDDLGPIMHRDAIQTASNKC